MTKDDDTATVNYALLSGGDIVLDDGERSGVYKKFSKMLAAYGEFVDPRGGKKPMVLDKMWAQKIVDNFKNGPIRRVPMVLGHPQSSAELAEKTRGWLERLEARTDGLYGVFEIRKKETADDIENGLIEQTSVAFDDTYQDKRTGKWYQHVLKHVGLVNDPYIKGMSAMEPVEMSGVAGAGVLFSDDANNFNNQGEEVVMATVKNDREFDVEVKYTENGEEKTVTIAAGAEVEVPEDQVDAVMKQIADAVAPPSDTEEKTLLDREKKLAEREAAAAKKEAELAEKEANARYGKLLSDGRIVPAQKKAFLALCSKGSASVELADGGSKTISVLLAELFENAPKGTYLSEQGNEGGDGQYGDRVVLSDEEKSLADDFGNTPQEIAEYKKLRVM